MIRADIIARRLYDCRLLDSGKPEQIKLIMDSLMEGRILIIANKGPTSQWVGALAPKVKLADTFTPEQITTVDLPPE